MLTLQIHFYRLRKKRWFSIRPVNVTIRPFWMNFCFFHMKEYHLSAVPFRFRTDWPSIWSVICFFFLIFFFIYYLYLQLTRKQSHTDPISLSSINYLSRRCSCDYRKFSSISFESQFRLREIRCPCNYSKQAIETNPLANNRITRWRYLMNVLHQRDPYFNILIYWIMCFRIIKCVSAI